MTKCFVSCGITGNYYLFHTDKRVVCFACALIGKCTTSVYFNNKYGIYCARVKSKKHKGEIKAFIEYFAYPSTQISNI